MSRPMPAPKLSELLEASELRKSLGRVLGRQLGPAPDGRYRHWHKLRFLDPPTGMTPEQWWLAIKLARSPLLKSLPLADSDGIPFRFAMVDGVLEKLHRIDR